MSDPWSGGFSVCMDCVDAGAGCSACVLRNVARAYDRAGYGKYRMGEAGYNAQALWRVLQGTLLNLSLQAGRQAGRQAGGRHNS